MKSFAWSFSVLAMFEQCRKKYFHIKVQKDAKDDDSQFSGEGKLIHDALKKRVIEGKPLPIELRPLEKMAAKLANTPGEKRGELQLAINSKYEPTGWFDDDAWCRVIIDLLIIKGTSATIIDYKTGKVREEWDQLKLCAAVLAIYMPEITDFKVTYIWTKNRHVSTPVSMQRRHMANVWSDLLPRVSEITDALKTTTFPATPSKLCEWCPVKQCPHHPTSSSTAKE